MDQRMLTLDVLPKFCQKPHIIFLTLSTRQLLFEECVTHDLWVMLGMLVGHAGDVENDAGDVDGLVQNASISRENAVKFNILLARTKNENKSNKTGKQKKSQNKSAPVN